jgi:peroxiredoxin Q/BCP
VSAGPIGVGDAVPDVALADQTGEVAGLRERVAGGPAVVYFYPKNNTPGCTVEACAFRDQIEEFRDLGVRVIGISSDSVESHAAFRERLRLPFTLLSDAQGRARAAFGVPRALGVFAGRTTYVVDAGGVVRRVFTSQLNVRRHVREALAALRPANAAGG